LQLITALVGGIVPGLIGKIVAETTSTAGVNVAPGAAASSMINVAIGAILAGLGASGFGADSIHTITTLAGVAVTVLSAVSHLGLLGSANANTEALIEQLLTQIANYQPPVAAEGAPVAPTV